MKIIPALLLLIISFNLKGQVLFVTNESNADINIYKTTNRYEADVFIYETNNRYESRVGYDKKNVVNFYTYVEGIYDKKIHRYTNGI